MRPAKIPKFQTRPGYEILAVVNELKKLTECAQMCVPSPREPEDECDAIGKHVAWQLRELKPIQRVEATERIHAILSKYRKKDLGALDPLSKYRPATPDQFESD